jgi:hypothetical protein
MLHLIAVHPDQQGRGPCCRLIAQTKRNPARDGQRAFFIGTSALPQYRLTRSLTRKAR